MSEVVYVEVVETSDGKFVYEARDSNHKVVETSKEFAKAQTAAQAGADAYAVTQDQLDAAAEAGEPPPVGLATVKVHGTETAS